MKKDPTFADSMAKYYPELVYTEFNPHDFEKAWKPFSGENNIDVKTIIAQVADQAYRKCVISIAMKLHVEESDVKVRRSQDNIGDLIVIVKNEPVGHITICFEYDSNTLNNKVVVTFHQHPK